MNYIGDFSEDSTIRISLTTNNTSGAAVAPSSAFEADDFRIYKNGSATQKTSDNGITITSPFDSVVGLHILEIDTSNDTGDSGFWTTGADYWVVAVPDETVASQTVVQVVAAFSIENRYMRGTDGANTTTPPTAAAIADAVLEESILDHRSVNHSLAKFISQIRNANLTIEGTVSSAITPTTLTFSSNVSATTSAYAHAVLLFVSGPLTGENSPIISYNNTNGVFVLEEPLTAAPSNGDEFVVIAGSHVHSVAAIQSGLATSSGVTSAFTEIKGAGWSSGTDTLEEIADAIAGSGTGARTVTVTVNDGTTALQNATVRMTAGAETYTATTNVSGVAVLNLDDATYTVAITKSGYSYAGTTLVVDGNESVTYSMTVITITPSSGSLVTGYWTCYSELGAVESGVTVTLQAVRVPSESGLALDSAARTATSAANGVAQFTNLIPGATYRVKRGSGDYYTIKISDTATGNVALNSILGT